MQTLESGSVVARLFVKTPGSAGALDSLFSCRLCLEGQLVTQSALPLILASIPFPVVPVNWRFERRLSGCLDSFTISVTVVLVCFGFGWFV